MLTLALVIGDMIVYLVSLPGNIFILGVKLLNWRKNKTLPLINQLIFAISLANLSHGLLKFARNVIGFFEANSFVTKTLVPEGILPVLFSTITSCNLWFCAWLSVHLCLKIVTINKKFYIILQKKFLEMSPWIILQSVLGSFLVSLLPVWNKMDEPLLNGTLNTSDGSMPPTRPLNSRHLYSKQIYIIFSLVAYLLSFSSALTIITSLCGHVNRMKANVEGLGGHNMEVLTRAAKTVTSLLVLNTLYVLFVKIGLFYRQNVIWRYSISISFSMFHILIAVVLIKGNKDLNTAVHVILARCACTKIFSKQLHLNPCIWQKERKDIYVIESV